MKYSVDLLPEVALQLE